MHNHLEVLNNFPCLEIYINASAIIVASCQIYSDTNVHSKTLSSTILTVSSTGLWQTQSTELVPIISKSN
jgi:hypothetical protein